MTPAVARRPVFELDRERLMFGIVGDRHDHLRRPQVIRQRVDGSAIAPERLVAGVALEQRENHPARRAAPFDDLEQLAERHQLLEPVLERQAADFAWSDGLALEHEGAGFGGALDQERLEIALVLDERLAAAALGAEQRRLRDVDVAAIDEIAHLPVEERQQQRPDVRSVDVRVGHDDDAVIAQLRGVEFIQRRCRSRAPRSACGFPRGRASCRNAPSRR